MVEDDDDWIATDAKSVLGPAYVAAPAAAMPTPTPTPSDPPAERELTLLQKLDQAQAEAVALQQERAANLARWCAEHADCGPFTREGFSGHGHGPSPTTGLWCWHLHPNWLGDPDEVAPEGSDLAARRAQQAALYDGDPFVHKTYPTDK